MKFLLINYCVSFEMNCFSTFLLPIIQVAIIPIIVAVISYGLAKTNIVTSSLLEFHNKRIIELRLNLSTFFTNAAIISTWLSTDKTIESFNVDMKARALIDRIEWSKLLDSMYSIELLLDKKFVQESELYDKTHNLYRRVLEPMSRGEGQFENYNQAVQDFREASLDAIDDISKNIENKIKK